MFKDRHQAGKLLSKQLLEYRGKNSVVVLAIPRGGVSVGFSLAKSLSLPLGVVVTKKLSAPDQEELAIGAVGPERTIVLDQELIGKLGIGQDYLEHEIEAKSQEVEKRLAKFNEKSFEVQGKTVILVDDGVATGSTVAAAIKYLRTKSVKEIVLAIPVVPREFVSTVKSEVEKIVVLATPTSFRAVGEFYENFSQVSDEEVLKLLRG